MVQEVSGITVTADGTAGSATRRGSNITLSPSYSSAAPGEYLMTLYGDSGDSATPSPNGSGWTTDANSQYPNANESLAIAYKSSTGGAQSNRWTISGSATEAGAAMVALQLMGTHNGAAALTGAGDADGRGSFARPAALTWVRHAHRGWEQDRPRRGGAIGHWYAHRSRTAATPSWAACCSPRESSRGCPAPSTRGPAVPSGLLMGLYHLKEVLMPWWGWLAAGIVIGTAWWLAAVVLALWLGPRLKRIREQQARQPRSLKDSAPGPGRRSGRRSPRLLSPGPRLTSRR